MSPQIKFFTRAIIVGMTLTYQNVMAAGGGGTKSWKSSSTQWTNFLSNVFTFHSRKALVLNAKAILGQNTGAAIR